jgi:6-phosphofructokinase
MPNAAFAFTGGPVNHQTLNTVAAAVVKGFSSKDIPVLGLSKGFTPILNGSAAQSVVPLANSDFENLLSMRGCPLFTERHLPRRSRSDWARVIEYLVSREIRYLVVTGGDGTFITLSHLADVNQQLQRAGRGLNRIVQIPRTMDGDFLKAEFDLGFASALHHGVESLRGFAGDNSLYGGPCVTRMMGRDEGWYALHCAAEYGAEMCLIPDEFETKSVDHNVLVDALVAHILVVLADQKRFSQILIAEGFWRALNPESQEILGMVRLGEDEHFPHRLQEFAAD